MIVLRAAHVNGGDSEPPRRRDPDRFGVIEFVDIDNLVFGTQSEPIDHRHPDADAVREVLTGLVNNVRAVRGDFEFVEEHAALREQLDGAEGQGRDDIRGQCARIRLDVERLEIDAGVAEIDVIELQGKDPVEAPAGEKLLRVAVFVEVDIDIVWDPEFVLEMLSDEGRLQLGMG